MKKNWQAYVVYLLIALVVLLPLWRPGFILTLDMVFTPKLPMPEAVTSSYVFHAALHYLNFALPGDVLQKLLLLSILLLSGIGMHRLIRFLDPRRHGQNWGIYAASIFFMVNPFTYSRFMAGQYSVLLGYSLLPWFVRLLLDFGRQPRLPTALKLGGLTTVIGVVSIHTLASIALLTLAASVVALWRYSPKLQDYLRYGIVALALFLAASSYWLVPLALGKGATSTMISQFTASDTAAFATAGRNPIVRLGNIARLQGFWAEERALYLLPQDRMVLWGLVALIIIALVVWGGLVLWRQRPGVLAMLAGSGLAAMLLAAGLMEALATFMPLLAGYREPHKLVGLVAMAYSVCLAFGINALLRRAERRSEAAYNAAAVLVLLLPLLLTRTMLLGFDGQLTPRRYPDDWFSLNQRLKNDPDNFAVVFLPWHQYMSFQFSGRIIASPAPNFFAKPTFTSVDPELQGATSGRMTPYQAALQQIITADDKTNLAKRLAQQNIKYLILAKDLDYRDYAYLNSTAGLKTVEDRPTAALYQNQAWRQP